MISMARTVLARAESIAEAGSMISMVAIMALITVDVFARYFFHAPLGITYSLTTLYLMASLFFLGFAATLSSHNHISVDLFMEMMSERTRRVCVMVTCALCGPLFAYVAYLFAVQTQESYAKSEAVMGTIMWPAWPPLAVVAFGLALLSLRFLLDLLAHVSTLLSGIVQAELPPRSGMENETAQ